MSTSSGRPDRSRRDLLRSALGTVAAGLGVGARLGVGAGLGAGARLGAGLGAAGFGTAGCSVFGDKPTTFDPASEVLPPDPETAVAVTTAPPVRTLADSEAAAAFFGKQFVPATRSSFGLDQTTIMPSDDPRFPEMLRVVIRANIVNTSSPIYGDGPTYGGSQMFVDHTLRQPYELYLRYYVRFPANFEFGKGGRLPGFFGTIVKDDRERVETDRFGLATRFAWRKGNAGIVYANTAREDHPINIIGKGRWSWETGRWICVEQGVKLNFEGWADGVIKIWLDGTEVHSEPFNPRISDKLKIGGLLVTATFGDGDRSFAPATDQSVDLAAFAIGTSRVNPLPEADPEAGSGSG